MIEKRNKKSQVFEGRRREVMITLFNSLDMPGLLGAICAEIISEALAVGL